MVIELHIHLLKVLKLMPQDAMLVSSHFAIMVYQLTQAIRNRSFSSCRFRLTITCHVLWRRQAAPFGSGGIIYLSKRHTVIIVVMVNVFYGWHGGEEACKLAMRNESYGNMQHVFGEEKLEKSEFQDSSRRN